MMSIIDILSFFVNTNAMENLKKIKVIDIARSIFLRYGYKRVTMQDLADAAGISRPALYLVFPNKEEIFKAVIKRSTKQSLNKIREGIDKLATTQEKLQYAFELWTVKPYELIRTAPDAKELIYSCYEFSREVFEKVGSAFEAELVKVINPLFKSNASTLTAKKTAKILRSAIRGFKDTAENSNELRELIRDFVAIVLLALNADTMANTVKNQTNVNVHVSH